MGAMIIPFRGAAERSAHENLAAFVAHAKSYRFFKGAHAVDWKATRWDLTPFMKRAAKETQVVHFTTFESSDRAAKNGIAFPDPYADAAKALLVEQLRLSGAKSTGYLIVALRAVEKSFRELGMAPDICSLTQEVLDRAAAFLRQTYADPYHYGACLQRFVEKLIEPGRLSTASLTWNHPFKKRRDDVIDTDLAKALGAKQRDKLPPIQAVIDLAGVFYHCAEPRDIVLTSWFALMMFAPSRAKEIVILPVACETEMDGVYGISWRPAKGGSPLTKFAPTEEWGSLAREAIQRLQRLGEGARRAAKWYEANPSKLYLSPDLEHLRGKPVTAWEIERILGRTERLKISGGFRAALEHCGVTNDGSRSWVSLNPDSTKKNPASNLYTFESLEKYVLGLLPKHFPSIDDASGLTASGALFCLPKGVLHGHEPYWNVPEFVARGALYGMIATGKENAVSIFERHNLINPSSGKAWRLTTHQARHLLNTVAQGKYLPQALIAFWSGRKNVKENRAYNSVPQEAIIESYVLMGENSGHKVHVSGPLKTKVEQRARREMISEEDALQLELGSVIVTRFGICRHDYSLTPCPLDKDCINCGENSFIKGDQRHLDEARRQHALHSKAADQAEQAVLDGEPDAERWLAKHLEKRDRWAMAIERLIDPDTPDGTIITLSGRQTPQTKTGLAINVRGIEQLEAHSADASHTSPLLAANDQTSDAPLIPREKQFSASHVRNLGTIRNYIASLKAEGCGLPSHGGELNYAAILKACGLHPNLFRRNRQAKQLVDRAANELGIGEGKNLARLRVYLAALRAEKRGLPMWSGKLSLNGIAKATGITNFNRLLQESAVAQQLVDEALQELGLADELPKPSQVLSLLRPYLTALYAAKRGLPSLDGSTPNMTAIAEACGFHSNGFKHNARARHLLAEAVGDLGLEVSRESHVVSALKAYITELRTQNRKLPARGSSPSHNAIARACGFNHRAIALNPLARQLLDEAVIELGVDDRVADSVAAYLNTLRAENRGMPARHSEPNVAAIARACGFDGHTLRTKSRVMRLIQEAWEELGPETGLRAPSARMSLRGAM